MFLFFFFFMFLFFFEPLPSSDLDIFIVPISLFHLKSKRCTLTRTLHGYDEIIRYLITTNRSEFLKWRSRKRSELKVDDILPQLCAGFRPTTWNKFFKVLNLGFII